MFQFLFLLSMRLYLLLLTPNVPIYIFTIAEHIGEHPYKVQILQKGGNQVQDPSFDGPKSSSVQKLSIIKPSTTKLLKLNLEVRV
jgi:hypothetical protein